MLCVSVKNYCLLRANIGLPIVRGRGERIDSAEMKECTSTYYMCAQFCSLANFSECMCVCGRNDD